MVRARLRTRNVRILLGLGMGAGVGIALFYARQLQGVGLFILTGAVAGAVAAVVEHSYRKGAQLTEVVVTVPHLSELRFVVTRDTKKVAWRLFVETVTRVSTQPLAPGTGSLREAMTSLYGLFQVVREILKETLPSPVQEQAPTVEQLAITMLNLELRPFLSRWHPNLRQWEQANPGRDESNWPAGSACRKELAVVQARIHDYAIGYARLAGVDDAAVLITGVRHSVVDGRSA
jgi:hypothetical protein